MVFGKFEWFFGNLNGFSIVEKIFVSIRMVFEEIEWFFEEFKWFLKKLNEF